MMRKLLVIGKEGRLAKLSPEGRLDPYQIVYAPMGSETQELIRLGTGASFILVDAMGRVDRALIEGLPTLKLIHSEGVGYQGVDVDAAREHGVYVCNCKGMNSTPVAEHTIMLMLDCLRHVIEGQRDVLEGRQIAVKEAYMKQGSLRELADCTIGLIGYGDIAKETARLAKAFGARCLCWHRRQSEPDSDAEQVPLDELLRESDIVSLHVPVTPATRGMVDAAFFERLKPGAILINTARGELVDTEALLAAMRAGRVSMAGLDCIAGEPVGLDNAIITGSEDLRDRLILTPHIAGITASSFRRGYRMVWDDIDAVAAGRRPGNIVNGL